MELPRYLRWITCDHPTWIVADLAFLGMGSMVFTGTCPNCNAKMDLTADQWMERSDGKVLPKR